MNSTKERVAQAFKEIVCRKSFQKITISDIARECDMTRENFYYHFHDKFDIIRWIMEKEILTPVADREDFVRWMKDILEAFEKDKIFYIRIINEIGKEALLENFTPVMKEKMKVNVERSLDRSIWQKRKEKLEFVTDFFTGAFVDFIFRMIISKDILSVEQLDQNINFLVDNYLPFIRSGKDL